MIDANGWIARRAGQDWRDADVLAAVEWMTAPLDQSDWNARLERTRETFRAAREEWSRGNRVPLFDPTDLAAWYVFQAVAYAADRVDWFEPEAYRLATPFQRIGRLREDLATIEGAQERAARMLTDGRRQPDDALYELLVAGAYRRRGWRDVAFIPERRGVTKTHDLSVVDGRRRWAAECKRASGSGYAEDERRHAERISEPLHRACREDRRSLVMEVVFAIELEHVPDDYLARLVDGRSGGRHQRRWIDETAQGVVREVDWPMLRSVLAHDNLFFGSSRMIQLAAGRYDPLADHSVDGDWTPSVERPFHAHDVGNLSIVSWRSASVEAERRKAAHFRRIVAKAADQLPGDRPGVVHVGYELRGGNGADFRRDLLNRMEMESFDPGASRLRWVYGNYMVPEHTTARMESAALTETTATYPVGKPAMRDPLPQHMLFSDGAGSPGAYWELPAFHRGTGTGTG